MTNPFTRNVSEPISHPGQASVELSQEAQRFNWLLDSFTANTAGVREAIAVSSDGLLMAVSATRDRASAERLGAVVSGMTSLAGGVANWYSMGEINRVVIDMTEGYLLMSSISAGSVLGVIADRSASLGTIAYEMTLFANRAGMALTPRLIAELKSAVQS
jgi:predicted regulator of Ras-like GTPase activity (Roadblock/LC7/MglB family)